MAKTPKAAAPRFDIDALRSLSGEATFARGAAYHAASKVEILSSHAGRITARVFGSETYEASLEPGADHPAGDCSCRAFADAGWCKHLVAVALAANDQAGKESAHSGGPLDPVRDHLRSLDAEALVELVLEQARKDPALMRRLELAAASARGDDAAIGAQLKKAITAATRMTDYVEYRQVRNWARPIGDLLDEIERLLDSGRNQLGLELLEHALDRVEQALASIDDSNGRGIDLLEQAAQLHLRACEAVRPDPVALAGQLFRRETESYGDAFYGAVGRYAEILGREGKTEYRRLAEAAWAQIPTRRADDRRSSQNYGGSSNQYGLFAILDQLAEEDGDFDRRIALLTKDLSTVTAYEKLVGLCLEHDRPEAALTWAEEGLWLFQDFRAERLALQTADLYLEAGRKADAEALLWRCFDRNPSFRTLDKLKTAAGGDPDGVVLDRAIAAMRHRLTGGQKKTGQWWGGTSDADFLAEIFLNNGRLAEAWAVTEAHGCTESTLLALAKASEATDPAKALAVYGELVERHLRSTNRAGYEAACRLIDRIGGIRKDRAEASVHAAYLTDLATRHKAKRNFMKLLAARV